MHWATFSLTLVSTQTPAVPVTDAREDDGALRTLCDRVWPGASAVRAPTVNVIPVSVPLHLSITLIA